ncbi:MAG: hypothetical protein AABX53_03330 [Nanoarchaeota archaeon]
MRRALWIMAIIIAVVAIAATYYFFNPFCGFRTTFSNYATSECAIEICLPMGTYCDLRSGALDENAKARIHALFENASTNQTP